MYTKPMYMSETFGDIFGMNKTAEADMFGVEIELEGKNIADITDLGFVKFWQPVEDNSLRKLKPGDQAVEYRFANPLNMADSIEALRTLEHHLTRPGVKVYESGRTSVHVHVNFVNESMATVYNFITLSTIFDELLVSQNGDHRIGNNFCLRAKDAEGVLIALSECVSNYGTLQHVNNGNRYSSINIMSLFKFGTIEFRSMECTTDSNRLINWLKTLQAIKVASRRFANPEQIMGQFSQLGGERFFLSVLGVQALTYMRVTDRHRMIFDGLRLVQEFANSATWEPVTKDNPYNSPIKRRSKSTYTWSLDGTPAPAGDPVALTVQQQYAQMVQAGQSVYALGESVNALTAAQTEHPHLIQSTQTEEVEDDDDEGDYPFDDYEEPEFEDDFI